jgi:hypothetical protein
MGVDPRRIRDQKEVALVSKSIVLSAGGSSAGTGARVARIRAAVDLYGRRDDAGTVLHHDGHTPLLVRMAMRLGRWLGWGGSRSVRELYAALCRSYEPGDEIFLIGFSEGAFTVRTLAGVIAQCGVIDRRHWQTDAALRRLVRDACSKHRMGGEPMHLRWARRVAGRPAPETVSRQLQVDAAVQHRELAPEGDVPIRLVGIWDAARAEQAPASRQWRRTRHWARVRRSLRPPLVAASVVLLLVGGWYSRPPGAALSGWGARPGAPASLPAVPADHDTRERGARGVKRRVDEQRQAGRHGARVEGDSVARVVDGARLE